MKITELLHKESIELGASVRTKEEAFEKLISLMDASGNLSDREEYKKGIYAREKQIPTAIGHGISIPHSQNTAVKSPGIAAMTVPAGIDCGALDGEVCNLFFMIAAPAKGADVHLQILSRLSVLLMDKEFRGQLLAIKNKDEYLNRIDAKGKEKFPEEK